LGCAKADHRGVVGISLTPQRDGRLFFDEGKREMNTRTTLMLPVAALASAAFVPMAMAEVITLNTNADTYISEQSPDANYGDQPLMRVRNREGRISGWGVDSLVGFDMAPISTWTEVTSATLHLYYAWQSDNDPSGRELSLHRVTESWDEMGVTWNTRPTFEQTPSGVQFVPVDTGMWIEWDVTADLQGFIDKTIDNFGWQVVDADPWGDWFIPMSGFTSKEADGFSPYLTIVPAPSSLGLLGLGGLCMVRRRRTR
jgi:hypothetical protein